MVFEGFKSPLNNVMQFNLIVISYIKIRQYSFFFVLEG